MAIRSFRRHIIGGPVFLRDAHHLGKAMETPPQPPRHMPLTPVLAPMPSAFTHTGCIHMFANIGTSLAGTPLRRGNGYSPAERSAILRPGPGCLPVSPRWRGRCITGIAGIFRAAAIQPAILDTRCLYVHRHSAARRIRSKRSCASEIVLSALSLAFRRLSLFVRALLHSQRRSFQSMTFVLSTPVAASPTPAIKYRAQRWTKSQNPTPSHNMPPSAFSPPLFLSGAAGIPRGIHHAALLLSSLLTDDAKSGIMPLSDTMKYAAYTTFMLCLVELKDPLDPHKSEIPIRYRRQEGSPCCSQTPQAPIRHDGGSSGLPLIFAFRQQGYHRITGSGKATLTFHATAIIAYCA